MNTKKYTLNITQEQLDKLYKALHVGSPIQVALSYAGIRTSQYYYMVEIASVVAYCREMDEIKNEEETIKSGVSMLDIREQSAAANTHDQHSNIAISAYKEPKGEAIQRYKTNRTYKEFADSVYEIIKKCDEMRSEIVLFHLTAIRDSAKQRGSNSNSSQWFLERTMPEFFGRVDKNDPTTAAETKVASIKVEYINPETKESKNRVAAMEEELLKQYNGESKA